MRAGASDDSAADGARAGAEQGEANPKHGGTDVSGTEAAAGSDLAAGTGADAHVAGNGTSRSGRKRRSRTAEPPKAKRLAAPEPAAGPQAPRPPSGPAAPSDARRRSLEQLAERIGHRFRDYGMLERALVHASTGNQQRENYERLEFLGDAVLGFLVAEALHAQKPEIPEGELTDRRARMVSRQPLAAIAEQLGLAAYLEVGRGLREQELQSARILADVVEAVLAAVYLDGGIRAARRFVRRHVLSHELDAAPVGRDPKSRLLHWAQSRAMGQPVYRVQDMHGPAHERTFTVCVLLQDQLVATGVGRSKQKAEKQAAELALRAIERGEAFGAGSPPNA